MWQWLDFTQYYLTSPTASKYEQSNRDGEAIEIFHRCFGFMWYFYGQRGREEFKKFLEGALKFFLDGIESCCVGVEGSSKSICVRRFSPSALSLFRFHLSPFPPETPDTRRPSCVMGSCWCSGYNVYGLSKLVIEPRTQVLHDIHFGDITIAYPDGIDSSLFLNDVVMLL